MKHASNVRGCWVLRRAGARAWTVLAAVLCALLFEAAPGFACEPGCRPSSATPAAWSSVPTGIGTVARTQGTRDLDRGDAPGDEVPCCPDGCDHCSLPCCSTTTLTKVAPTNPPSFDGAATSDLVPLDERPLMSRLSAHDLDRPPRS